MFNFLEFQRIRNNRGKFDRIIGFDFWKNIRSNLKNLYCILHIYDTPITSCKMNVFRMPRLLFLKILIFCEIIWPSAWTGAFDKLTHWNHMLNRLKNFEFFSNNDPKYEIFSETMNQQRRLLKISTGEIPVPALIRANIWRV
jgi:hypothetical protein